MTTKIFTCMLAISALLPVAAFAQEDGLISGQAGALGDFVAGVVDLINNFLIPLVVALAVLMFIYGVFQFFILGGADEEKRAAGRSLMLYSIIGFVLIVGLWAVVSFVAAAIGLEVGAGALPTPSTPPVGG